MSDAGILIAGILALATLLADGATSQPCALSALCIRKPAHSAGVPPINKPQPRAPLSFFTETLWNLTFRYKYLEQLAAEAREKEPPRSQSASRGRADLSLDLNLPAARASPSPSSQSPSSADSQEALAVPSPPPTLQCPQGECGASGGEGEHLHPTGCLGTSVCKLTWSHQDR